MDFKWNNHDSSFVSALTWYQEFLTTSLLLWLFENGALSVVHRWDGETQRGSMTYPSICVRARVLYHPALLLSLSELWGTNSDEVTGSTPLAMHMCLPCRALALCSLPSKQRRAHQVLQLLSETVKSFCSMLLFCLLFTFVCVVEHIWKLWTTWRRKCTKLMQNINMKLGMYGYVYRCLHMHRGQRPT